MLGNLACHLRYALIIIVVIIVIVLLSRWTGKSASPPPPPPVAAASLADVKSVVAEAAAANEAAHAQPNRLDALVEVTAALATLNTATSLAGKEPVTTAAGVPVRTLEHEMGAHQRQLMMELQGTPAPPALQPLPKI